MAASVAASDSGWTNVSEPTDDVINNASQGAVEAALHELEVASPSSVPARGPKSAPEIVPQPGAPQPRLPSDGVANAGEAAMMILFPLPACPNG